MANTVIDTEDAILDVVVREGHIKRGSTSCEYLWEEPSRQRQQEVQRLACREEDEGYVKAVVGISSR